MVEIWFPGITIPGFKLTRGQLLDVSLFGVGLVIPPFDIEFWKETTILGAFRLFETDDIAKAVIIPVAGIAEAVWSLFESKLDEMAHDYYERHKEES